MRLFIAVVLCVILSQSAGYPQMRTTYPITAVNNEILPIRISPNGKTVIVCANNKGEEFIQINDYVLHGEKNEYPILFSNDGSNYAVSFRKEIFGGDYIKTNDTVYGPYYIQRLEYDFFFLNDDGSRYMFYYYTDRKKIHINNKDYYMNDFLDKVKSDQAFLQSVGLKHYGYRYEAGLNIYNIIVNNLEFGTYYNAFEPIFSSDNTRWAFWYQDTSDYDRYVMTSYTGRIAKGCYFHPKFFGTHSLAYGFADEKGSYVQVGDRRFGPFEYVSPGISLSPNDTNHFGFIYRIGKMEYAQVTDRVFGPYLTIRYLPTFRGNLFMLLYEKEKYNWYVFLNEKEYGPFYYESWWGPEIKYALDGTKFGIAHEKNGKYYVSANDKNYGPYDNMVKNIDFYGKDNKPVFELYVERDEIAVVIDGRIINSLQGVDYATDRDGKLHIAYKRIHEGFITVEEYE